jgi:hypothetical protein
MIRRIRIVAVLAVVASLALAGLAQAKVAPVSLAPSSGKADTVFTLKLTGQKFQNAEDNSEYLQADLVAPAGADEECAVHQGFSYRSTGAGAKHKVVFTLDPNMLYSQAWCKGTWKVKIVAVNTDEESGSPIKTPVAAASFKVR